jgi:hypothetical protein
MRPLDASRGLYPVLPGGNYSVVSNTATNCAQGLGVALIGTLDPIYPQLVLPSVCCQEQIERSGGMARTSFLGRTLDGSQSRRFGT